MFTSKEKPSAKGIGIATHNLAALSELTGTDCYTRGYNIDGSRLDTHSTRLVQYFGYGTVHK
jgi:hypothetical protein